MTKYGRAAFKAVKLLESGKCQYPKEAWMVATSEIFGEGSSGQKKGCPRNAFLGLCEEGMVKGVEAGEYCYSNKNKDYAVNAVSLLKQNPSLSENKNELWFKAVGEPKSHNNQMDVVIGLWENGLLKDL